MSNLKVESISFDTIGLDDFSPGDADKFSKSFSGRRHAIGNTEDKSFSLIEGMFSNQIDDGNILCIYNSILKYS